MLSPCFFHIFAEHKLFFKDFKLLSVGYFRPLLALHYCATAKDEYV